MRMHTSPPSAYLTNPSETSFRTYLTELSFKQHLSQLDENGQDDSTVADDSGVHYSLSRRSAVSARKLGSSFDTSSPFHFVSRATVSLRTPKHVFHSFGILTVAAVYPTGRPNSRPSGHHAIHCDGLSSAISDAWYIGAFGRWWKGGVIQSWWHEMLANVKDAERCGSGLLDVKALDRLEGFDGEPFLRCCSNPRYDVCNRPAIPNTLPSACGCCQTSRNRRIHAKIHQ